jgi:hypothetical protein
MDRRVLLALLMLVACSARADWLQVSHTERATHYIEPSSLSMDGPFRRVWTLVDYWSRKRHVISSAKVYVEVDCARARLRTLEEIYFARALADGRPIGFTGGPNSWQPIAPETAEDDLYRAVCGK